MCAAQTRDFLAENIQ